jgi:hypothetical protein
LGYNLSLRPKQFPKFRIAAQRLEVDVGMEEEVEPEAKVDALQGPDEGEGEDSEE